MKPIRVVDGKAMCPECGKNLYAAQKAILWSIPLYYNFARECWDMPIMGKETEIVDTHAIYCEGDGCGYELTGDAIHSVEVEEA